MNKRHHELLIDNPFVDPQGYFGSENCLVHDALTSIFKLQVFKELKLSRTINSYVFIDDGLISIKSDAKFTTELKHKITDLFIDVFRIFGFTVDKTKMYASSSFGIYLNEIYINGFHIIYGFRAALKIGTKPLLKTWSLTKKVAQITACVRGAVKAGTHIVVAQMLLFINILWRITHINWWSMSPESVLFFLISPSFAGGLDVPIGKEFLINASDDRVQTGLSRVVNVIRVHVDYLPVLNTILGLKFHAATSRDLIARPLGLTSEMSPKHEDMFRKHLIKYIHDNPTNYVMESILSWATSKSLEQIGDRLKAHKQRIAVPKLEDLYTISDEFLFDKFVNKFTNISTMRALVGRKTINLISRSMYKEGLAMQKRFLDKYGAYV
jgi:hypothetical protein